MLQKEFMSWEKNYQKVSQTNRFRKVRNLKKCAPNAKSGFLTKKLFVCVFCVCSVTVESTGLIVQHTSSQLLKYVCGMWYAVCMRMCYVYVYMDAVKVPACLQIEIEIGTSLFCCCFFVVLGLVRD